MSIQNFIQRKLATVLQPWLLQEPELEFKLGFLRSHGIVKNLRFDTSALNKLLDESSGFSFTDLRVDQLSLRISYWSVPAFNFEVQGVHVDVAPRVVEGEDVGRHRESKDLSLEDRKKVLCEIDPEGSALHDVIGRIAEITLSRSKTTSLPNLILRYCRLQMRNINLKVESSISGNSFGCSWEIKELKADSRLNDSGCFLRGYLGSLFIPSKRSYFDLEIGGLVIKLQSNDRVNPVFYATDIICSMNLNDLQLITFQCFIEELVFTFSPADFSIIAVLMKQSSRSFTSIRNGRQLWKETARRIRSLISTRRWSMWKLFSVVLLWLRYVNAYENLLVLIGYPVDVMIKRSAVKMSEDQIFSRSFRCQLEAITEIENGIPAQGIALARRVVRYRVSKNVVPGKEELPVNSYMKYFQNVVQLTGLIWNSFCGIFNTILHWLLFRQTFGARLNTKTIGVCPKHSCTDLCYRVKLGKVSFTISPDKAVQPAVGRRIFLDSRVLHSDLLSFCLLFDTFFLIYNENICEHRLAFSCGSFKVMSSSATEANTNNYGSSMEGRENHEILDSKTNLWGKPALVFNQERVSTTGANNTEVVSLPLLESLLHQTWLDLKISCADFEKTEDEHLEIPFILCEIKGSLTNKGINDMSCGFSRCCLALGQLEIFLGYSSILSSALLLCQMQHAFIWNTSNQRAKELSHSPISFEDPPVKVLDCDSSIAAMEKALHKLLPEKCIQVGVFIVGPQMRVSLIKDILQSRTKVKYETDDLHLMFDCKNIELIMSPNLASNTVLLDATPKGNHLKDLQTADFDKSDDKIYQCQGQISLDGSLKIHGLKTYLDDSTELQPAQIMELNPITIQLSTLRKETRSLSKNIVAFSAALHGIALGLSVLVFIEELCFLVEVVDDLICALSRAFDTIDSSSSVGYQHSISQELLHVRSEKRGPIGTANGTSLVILNTIYALNCTSEIQSIDMVIHKSREGHNQAISESFKRQHLAVHFLPDYGIQIHFRKLCMDFLSKNKDMKAEGLADLSGFQVVIFRYANDITSRSDQFHVHNLLPHARDHIHEASVSNCTFSFSLTSLLNELSPTHREVGGATSRSNISHTMEDSLLTSNTQESTAQSTVAPASSTCFTTRIVSTEIYLVGCPFRDIVVGKHQTSKLEISLSVEDLYHPIVSCQCQGGVIVLEMVSAVIFSQCWNSYLRCIRHLFRVAPLSEENISSAPSTNTARVEDHPGQEMLIVPHQAQWGIWEKITMDLSKFYLALMARDESGRLQELQFSADMHLDLKVVDTRKKFSFGLPKLSISSRVLQETTIHESSEVQIPLIPSNMSRDPSFHLIPQDTGAAFEDVDFIPTGASCSNSDSKIEPYNEDSHQGSQYYILKQLICFIAAEEFTPKNAFDTCKSNQHWVGSGSISGVDATISLPELQMILSAAELFGGSSKETTSNVQQMHMDMHNNQEPVRNSEEMVPDGSIIAIQDVHQHMYIAIESAGSKYRLVGTMHYSLAAEMSLFRVKYHYQKLWKSSDLWFSLTSLHAKSHSGEPLQLNCNPKSGFVEISSSSNSGAGLWRAMPCKSTSIEDDSELDMYNNEDKGLFYLINRKNNCSIAFVDGVLEFVSKPGNPFKLKVFQNFAPTHDLLLPDSSSVMPSRTDAQDTLHADEEKFSGSTWEIPCISVMVDKFSLTINHELSETKEKFPLLQMSITASEFIVQIMHAKARVMTSFVVELNSFDAQKNSWSTFVHPVEVSIYNRFRFQSQDSETLLHEVSVHFNARVKELRISITELSLDVLLFVIGKLDLAGPFAIRNSVILANCCKVENQSGPFLLCQFPDKQYASIARKQSTIVFLRNLTLNQPPEASTVSIQLAERGALSTFPMEISLLQATKFAWRTRIVSKNDSKTFPGPFVVVEVSRKAEDGLSVVVSPLLRIHNKTDFPVELRFQRPEQEEDEYASLVLMAGDTFDDSTAAFDAIKVSGGSKKALISLSVGNFIFSFRPRLSDDSPKFKNLASVGWSDEFKGGKAALLSGLFDQISYHVRKAFPVESAQSSFSTACSSLKSKDGQVSDVHFLIQNTTRKIPISQPYNSGRSLERRISPVALQEQKEICIFPTVQISNLLQTEIHVLLTDKDVYSPHDCDNMSKQATISQGSTINMYANPHSMFFTITLTEFKASCKPVDCGDWAKKLMKPKKDARSLDMELNFGGGKYFSSLRLSCGHRGILEATILTPITLKNNTDFGLFCLAPNKNPLSRDEAEKLGSGGYSELGAFLPPNSAISWFMRTNKVHLKLLNDNATKAPLDLDALSGLTEIDLETEERSGFKYISKLGVSLRSSMGKGVQSQVVSLSPRYVLLNESEEAVTVRQCYMEKDDMEGMTTVNSKQRKALRLCNITSKKKEASTFENFIRKHRNSQDDSLLFIQFQLKEAGLSWSGPVCVASMGKFFLKFRKSMEFPDQETNQKTAREENVQEFAVVIVAEEDSTLVLRFRRPPDMNLPYRIENSLHDASITYYQKGSDQPETLGSAKRVDYVWDDLTLPHKLVIQISGASLLREINLDKVRAWKPFYKVRLHRALGIQFPLDKKTGYKGKQKSFSHLNDMEIVNWGYEVYADGLTRVLRVCDLNDSRKLDRVFYPGAKMKLRVSRFSIHLCEHPKQEEDMGEPPMPIIVMRLGNISLDSAVTDQHKVNQIKVQSLSVDQKWVGAPFAAMLRKHQTDYSDTHDSMLRVVLILLPSTSNIRQVKYSSIVLQPIDLNLDEETLMRIVPFWRTSLSDPNTPSQQYYFDHFEIHPVKIIATFLPGDSYSSYNSRQDTLRSLLHSVIKVPEIRKKTVELNGVLVTHALITIRELSIKSAQHYSWYVMRAIYMAKGSTLLPPAFASIFDDLASSSLDVFFDPSTGLVNLPGLTIGTFKLLSKCIDGKGFSGTKRYFGDLGKSIKLAGSNILFAAVTEISDSVLKGAESSGFNGMVSGFHQGILKLAMEPAVLGSAFMEGGPDRKIKLDRSPAIDELYIEGYLQAMLDTVYKQEYLRVRVIDDQVVLKNLPPNSTLIDDIMDRVNSFLVSKGLLKGETSFSHPLRHLRAESEWKIGRTVLTLCEHLFVSFAIRWLRKQAGNLTPKLKWNDKVKANDEKAIVPMKQPSKMSAFKWGVGQFVLSGIVAYIDGRLCRSIPNPIVRRIVSGFLFSFLDKSDDK